MKTQAKAPEKNWIVHLDMDAFYAAVECLDNKELINKAIIIGHDSPRSVVSTCSYQARARGVRSAMPMLQAKKLCPHAIIIRPRMQRYLEVSQKIIALLSTFSPLVEQASIDEAYIDITDGVLTKEHASSIAKSIQSAIKEQLNLSCSIGLAPVKFIAKIASDMHKPAGFTCIAHDELADFLQKTPAWKIPGVGRKTWTILEQHNIQYAADLLQFSEEFWISKLGKFGHTLYKQAQGIDTREVCPEIEAKSEGAESTFPEDTMDAQILSQYLYKYAARISRNLRKKNKQGKTISLKIKYHDFSLCTRSKTLAHSTNDTREVFTVAMELLNQEKIDKKVRLIGIAVSHFTNSPRQLSLMESEEEKQKKEKLKRLDRIGDELYSKYGVELLKPGILYKGKSS